jgi:hypothetical protein
MFARRSLRPRSARSRTCGRSRRVRIRAAIGRWAARLCEHACALEWALGQAARELDLADDADEAMLDVDDAELDDEVNE